MSSRRLLLPTLAATVLLLGLLTAFGLELADTQARSKQDVIQRVHERATLATALIDSVFEASAAGTARSAPALTEPTVRDATLEAMRRRGGSPYVALLDASGRVVARSSGFTAQARAGLGGALATVRGGRPYGLGDSVPYGSGRVLALAVPLRTASGTRVLVQGFRPAALAGFVLGELRRIPGVRGAYNYLLDGSYTVLASTNPERPTGYVFDSPRQRAALSRSTGTTRSDRYYEQVGVAGSRWRVMLGAPRKELFASVSGLHQWVPWIIFGAFALATMAAVLLARRSLRASDQVRAQSAQLALLNTELATTNEALERRADELARSNGELEQFASIASHDLQEPLRKVRTFTEQLTVIEADRLSERGRDYLGRTNAAAERMQRLIEDLLRFSRVATQGRPFAEVDLAVVAREVLGDLELEVERAGATVELGELPVVRGDGTQLRQLLQNLISNGLKFRRADAGCRIEVAGSVAGSTATLVVRDDGIGFEPQYAERIFRVFERLHGRSTYPGTGIGLALCRKIAERHGGTIVASSELGEGATFTVTLPVDQREEVVVAERPARELPAEPADAADPREPAHA